eukprot:m.21692 g.21692  ORF g.21692 m.21692 type:complete len:66 (-) comp12505_c0_seq1:46-243(-)
MRDVHRSCVTLAVSIHLCELCMTVASHCAGYDDLLHHKRYVTTINMQHLLKAERTVPDVATAVAC